MCIFSFPSAAKVESCLDEGKHRRNRIFFIFLLIRKPFSLKRWPACRYGQCAKTDELVLGEHILLDMDGLVSVSSFI